jgi:hypothetical protein
MDLQFYEKEKREMAETQLHFIKYAVEEILEYVEKGGKIEEWYQNKLSKVHSDMEGMHSWMEGEKRRTGMVSEDVEQIDELSSKKMLDYRSKAVGKLGKGTPQQDVKRKVGIAVSGSKIKQRLKQSMRKENTEISEGENPQVKGGDPCWKGYEMVGMKKKGGKEVPNCVPVKEQVSDAPFDAPYSSRKTPTRDKSGAVHGPMSMAKHLAKTALKKQKERMAPTKPTKTTQESRKTEIVREASKKQKQKNVKTDKFEPEPELNDSIIKSE